MSTDHEAHVPTPDLPLTAPLPTLGERLSEGDADALAALFEREASSIYHFALGYLRSEASAEDIVQTVFIRAWERHGDLRDPDRVRAWLFSIARNLVRDQLRAPSLDSVDDHFALPAPGRAPEDEAAAREERELVWTAAQSLEPRQALVLDLAVRQQFTSSEIGEALGYRPGHAAVLVSRAKQALAGAVTSLLIARRVGRCERLALLVPESPVALSPEERRTVDHHMRRCPVCQHNAGLVTSPAELFSLIPLAVLSGETAQQLWHRAAQSTGSLRLTAAQPPCPPSPTGRNATPPSTSPPRAGQPPTVAQGRQQMNATPPPRGYPLSHLPRWVLATGLAALVAAVVGGTVVVIHGSQPAPSSRSAAAQPPGTCAEIPERVLAAIGGGTGDLRVCITHSLDNGLVSAFYLTLHSTSGGVGIAAGDFVAVGADHSIELQSSAGFGCWNSALHFLPNDTVSPTTPLCIQDGASAVNELGVQAELTASNFFFPVARPDRFTTPPPPSTLVLSGATMEENAGTPTPVTVTGLDQDVACTDGDLWATTSLDLAGEFPDLDMTISPLDETATGTLSMTWNIGESQLSDQLSVRITATAGALVKTCGKAFQQVGEMSYAAAPS